MILETGEVKESVNSVVRRAMSGDQDAFYQLFRRYERPLRSFLHSMTGRWGVTDDLAQETLSRAFQLLPDLRDESKFSTWIFGIARNVALEACRRQSLSPERVEWDYHDVQTLCDSSSNPESAMIKDEFYKAVSHGFKRLDEDLRTVLALRVVAEKKYSEIAEITGWSLPKVKVEIYRARLKMREILEPHLRRK